MVTFNTEGVTLSLTTNTPSPEDTTSSSDEKRMVAVIPASHLTFTGDIQASLAVILGQLDEMIQPLQRLWASLLNLMEDGEGRAEFTGQLCDFFGGRVERKVVKDALPPTGWRFATHERWLSARSPVVGELCWWLGPREPALVRVTRDAGETGYATLHLRLVDDSPKFSSSGSLCLPETEDEEASLRHPDYEGTVIPRSPETDRLAFALITMVKALRREEEQRRVVDSVIQRLGKG